MKTDLAEAVGAGIDGVDCNEADRTVMAVHQVGVEEGTDLAGTN